MTLTAQEQKKLRQEVEERRTLIAKQLRDDLLAVLGTPAGRRLWVWWKLEVLGVGRAANEERLRVWTETEQALLLLPELRASLIAEQAEIEKTEAFYQAAQARLRASRNTKES